MGIVNRSIGRLPSHPHPFPFKEIPKILPQVSGVPIHLPSIRTGHSPPGLYHDCKGVQAHGPLLKTQTPPILGRLADQVSVSGGSPSEHSGSGRSNPVFGMDHQSGKIRTESYSGVFVRGLRVPPRFSPCKTHSREMAQTSGFYPTPQVKTCFDCKMFDVSNWVASLNGENGPEGTTSHEALSVSHQGALEISPTAGQPPSLDRSHLCTPRLVTESCKHDERLRPSSQRPQYPTLYRRLKRRLGRSFRTKFYTRSVVTPGKRATHKRPRIKSCLYGPETLQTPVSGPNSASCNGQLNCGSLHKQTRRNTLSGDVCTPVENHDLVPSLPHNIESQAHSRVPECDGRPAVQVESGPIDRMVTTSTGVQTDQQALDLVHVKAHDIRAFAASKALYHGVSVDQIMQACHWKAHNTFTTFYLKDNNLHLGPVVAAQQVLDPSPQSSHPRKENKGGHISYNQVFRSLSPGSRYTSTSSGCIE